MVERLIILKHNKLNDTNDKNGSLTKTQSFNTDDDDSVTAGDLQQTEQDDQLSKSNENLLSVDQSKRSLLSLNSPSIDSVNDPDGSVSDNPIGEKLKKKKRRTTERMDSFDRRRSVAKIRPWYLKIDLTKPILCLVLLFLLYLMWAKHDVWIPRLLTSNSRVRLTALKHEEKLNEQKEIQPTKNSSFSGQDEIVNDNNNNNNDQSSAEDNDDDDNDDVNDSPTVSNKQPSQKLNIRIRKNKMRFTRDRPTKQSRYSTQKILDDDDDDVNDNGEDDEDLVDSIQSTDTVLPTSTHSNKKHHRHRHHHVRSDPPKTKTSNNGKNIIIARTNEDIVEQLKKLIKSHGKNRDILSTLTKETGLNKAKINRFINQKDLSAITLDDLISILNSFDSTILIVSK